MRNVAYYPAKTKYSQLPSALAIEDTNAKRKLSAVPLSIPSAPWVLAHQGICGTGSWALGHRQSKRCV